MKTNCTCDPAYRESGRTAEDPCGHGDTSEGCPMHDAELVALIVKASACGLDVDQFESWDDLHDAMSDVPDDEPTRSNRRSAR